MLMKLMAEYQYKLEKGCIIESEYGRHILK